MAPNNIHLMGIVPGETTGWYLVTVPRFSIFFDDPPAILEYDWGQFDGDEEKQAMELARLAREVQSLDYKVGPALVCDADSAPSVSTMLRLLRYQGKLWDATLTLQDRTLARKMYPDETLRRKRLWTEDEQIRDACRHAFTALRRANENLEFAKSLWPYREIHR